MATEKITQRGKRECQLGVSTRQWTSNHESPVTLGASSRVIAMKRIKPVVTRIVHLGRPHTNVVKMYFCGGGNALLGILAVPYVGVQYMPSGDGPRNVCAWRRTERQRALGG